MIRDSAYLLAGQESELERLRLQSRVWEPAARALLETLPRRATAKAVDIGCGAMGWLRVLSEWVGRHGSVLGTDIDERMLSAASSFVDAESLSNVALLKDDLFETRLPERAFDLLHARFQIAPLGRGDRQLASYLPLIKQGGWRPRRHLGNDLHPDSGLRPASRLGQAGDVPLVLAAPRFAGFRSAAMLPSGQHRAISVAPEPASKRLFRILPPTAKTPDSRFRLAPSQPHECGRVGQIRLFFAYGRPGPGGTGTLRLTPLELPSTRRGHG